MSMQKFKFEIEFEGEDLNDPNCYKVTVDKTLVNIDSEVADKFPELPIKVVHQNPT